MKKVFNGLLYNNNSTGFMDNLHIAGDFDKEEYKKVKVAIFTFMKKVLNKQSIHPKDIAEFCMLCYDIPQFESIEGVSDLEDVVLNWLESLDEA